MKHTIPMNINADPRLLASATEIHVAITGDDANPGTRELPLRTIQRAANLAQPGDVVTVHEGIYRERINPPRGGASDTERIVFQAAPSETVEIKGSEIVRDWTLVGNDLWSVRLPNAFFGSFNPYSDLIHGDWFDPKDRRHHTGAVYLNGEWLIEAAGFGELLAEPGKTTRPGARDDLKWFALVDTDHTTIWARFGGANPNQETVEINVRRTVYYPEKTGVDFLTVRGFGLFHAATPWAPPTSEQVGLIGTNWSRGWIIENNRIGYSICSGVALGKHGDEWDNQSANTATGYVETIEHGLKQGWAKGAIGGHIVRNNTIAHCEQTGIVGSLGCCFSIVEDNTIHDIHVRRLFGGAEMAGIKFHGAIDTQIRRNHIYRGKRGLWLDWMSQGTRVSGNVFHDHDEDLFTEVNHGPTLVDNNCFLSSSVNLRCQSLGTAFVHNLFAGSFVQLENDERITPWFTPHSTAGLTLHDLPSGDHRFLNNLFVGNGDMGIFDSTDFPLQCSGNVFCGEAKPGKFEQAPLTHVEKALTFSLMEKDGGMELVLELPVGWTGDSERPPITSASLGLTAISKHAFETPDEKPIQIDTDYFGNARGASATPGPFEALRTGKIIVKLR